MTVKDFYILVFLNDHSVLEVYKGNKCYVIERATDLIRENLGERIVLKFDTDWENKRYLLWV